jgi:hypothetical protein
MWNPFSARSHVRRLERSGNVAELTRLAQVCGRESRMRHEAEGALARLGYRCVFHEEQGHMETRIEEHGPYYCTGSDANSNCYAGCVNGNMCTRSTQEVCTWVIDVPARLEVLRK